MLCGRSWLSWTFLELRRMARQVFQTLHGIPKTRFKMHLRHLIPIVLVPLFLQSVIQGVSSMPAPMLRLQHRFSGREGSSKRNKGKGMTSEYFQQLRAHDTARHVRKLISAASFPLGGIADPYLAGLYFTELNIGTPPSKYYVQVDTGSDLLWLNCAPCSTCPSSTGLGVDLTLYDPSSSSSSTSVSCNNQICSLVSSSNCGTVDYCPYTLKYGDGSSSQGYLIEDTLHLDLVAGNPTNNSIDATVTFGCGTSQGGQLQQAQDALDGILGLGQSDASIIQQLVSQGKTPGTFAHCLEGEGRGGGILVIGDVQAHDLVYTPIIQNQGHYNVNLKSISVNGQRLQIDPSAFSVGQSQEGTIIDSGTTLAYIVEPAYNVLINAILLSGPSGLSWASWQGMTCVSYSGSLDQAFASVTFSFDGEKADMVVEPHDYFIQADGDIGKLLCIGFQSQTQSNLDATIIGDLILKDKLFVYDLDNQRIGWVDYNCSSSVIVLSLDGQSRSVNASAIGNISSTSCVHNSLRFKTIMIFLILIVVIVWF